MCVCVWRAGCDSGSELTSDSVNFLVTVGPHTAHELQSFWGVKDTLSVLVSLSNMTNTGGRGGFCSPACSKHHSCYLCPHRRQKCGLFCQLQMFIARCLRAMARTRGAPLALVWMWVTIRVCLSSWEVPVSCQVKHSACVWVMLHTPARVCGSTVSHLRFVLFNWRATCLCIH